MTLAIARLTLAIVSVTLPIAHSQRMSEKHKSLPEPPPKSPILGDFEGESGSEVPQIGGLGGECKNL
jgi:hypothetical protein